MANLLEATETVVQWEWLGHSLEVPRHIVDQIARECRKVVDAKLKLFGFWLDNDKNASWKKLAVALRKINQSVLANLIWEKFTGTLFFICIKCAYKSKMLFLMLM